MKIEILYFDGCPTYLGAEQTVREVFAEQGTEAEVALVPVNTDEEAERLRFPGSPTIRVDGRDLFPVPDRDVWALGCRTYTTPEGLKGYPTAEMIRDALRPHTGRVYSPECVEGEFCELRLLGVLGSSFAG